jgi:hypothetical protein
MIGAWRSTIVALFAIVLAAPALAQPKKTPPPNPLAIPNTAANPDLDIAFGAYQRGFYLTALAEATKRAQQKDTQAMTLLGELYAQGLGVGRDDSKAAQWYKLAAAQGDRGAMFALAMFNFEGRAGSRNPDEGARLLSGAAQLGHPAAAYDLGLLYLQGQQLPQDFQRAAELFRTAAAAGNPEAQYALATMYKEGRGVPKDVSAAVRRQCRRHGRVRHRAVQRRRHREGRGGVRPAFPDRGPPRQRDRAEPAGAHPDGRARHARRSDRSGEMAPDRQGGRRRRSRTRRVRRQAEAGAARRRRESRCQVAVDRGGAAALTARASAGRPQACTTPLCSMS